MRAETPALSFLAWVETMAYQDHLLLELQL